MENQAELADKLIRIACSESYWKHLHEAEMKLQEEFTRQQIKKRRQRLRSTNQEKL